MNHGETLRKIRRQGDFSQDYIALKLGISQKAYSNLEHKFVIDDKKLSEIFAALEITKEEFDNYVDDIVFASSHNDSEKSVIQFLLKIVEEQSELIKKLLNLPPPLRISLTF